MLQRVLDEAGIANRMDRLPLTLLHVWALCLCALGFAFDLLEIGLGSALAAVFSTPPNLAPAGVLLLRWLTPLQPLGIEAWRWAFVAGGAGAALVGMLFRALPESPRWLVAVGRDADALAVCRAFERSTGVLPSPNLDEPAQVGTAGASSAEQPATPLRRWSLVGGVFLLSPWATVAFPLLTGAVLTQKGFKLSDALLYVALSMFGPLLGTLLAAVMIDRIERRTALACSAVVMVVAGACFVASDTPAWLVASSIVFGVFGFLYVTTLNLYGAELFPTRSRAASIAGAWALNRVGAVIAPLLLLPLLELQGAASMFAVIAATLACSAVLLLAAPPGKQRKTVG